MRFKTFYIKIADGCAGIACFKVRAITDLQAKYKAKIFYCENQEANGWMYIADSRMFAFPIAHNDIDDEELIFWDIIRNKAFDKSEIKLD